MELDVIKPLPQKPTLKLNLFKKELILFGAVQALALFSVSRIRRAAPEAIFQPMPADFGLFLFYFLVATLFFLILLKFSRRRGFLKFFWMLAIVSGMHVLFRTLIREDFALLGAVALAAMYWKVQTVAFHNFVLVLALPAIGALFGSQLTPPAAVALLALFSLYDVIAVYGTKHMVVMAAAFLQEHVVPGIILSEQRTSGPVSLEHVSPGAGFSILGSGDLVFPAMLSASAFLENPFVGLITAISSFVGLFITHALFFGQKVRRPMPALPPIAAAAIAGYVIAAALMR